jgi:hypothetical protein
MCMCMYVCMRLFPFVFITIHAQLVIKKCSIKIHSYFSILQSVLQTPFANSNVKHMR